MTRRTKIIIIIFSAIFLIVVGGLYFLYFFLSSFSLPDIKITKDFVKTDRDFINGVTIEKITVDSMGDKGYPVKYTKTYLTSCGIHHPTGKPTEPPDIIYFKKTDRYSWDEDTLSVRYEHIGLSREPLDSISKLWWLDRFGDHPVCPLNFEKGQWYYFTFGDPKITGIFFYIDKDGHEHQFYLGSGVSPI